MLGMRDRESKFQATFTLTRLVLFDGERRHGAAGLVEDSQYQFMIVWVAAIDGPCEK